MSYHGFQFKNKEAKKLLAQAKINPKDFTLQIVKGKPAKTKGIVKIDKDKVVIYGSDFVAKGFLTNKEV